MHHKRRVTIFAAIIAVAATLPAAATARKPVIFDHESFVDGPYTCYCL